MYTVQGIRALFDSRSYECNVFSVWEAEQRKADVRLGIEGGTYRIQLIRCDLLKITKLLSGQCYFIAFYMLLCYLTTL